MNYNDPLTHTLDHQPYIMPETAISDGTVCYSTIVSLLSSELSMVFSDFLRFPTISSPFGKKAMNWVRCVKKYPFLDSGGQSGIMLVTAGRCLLRVRDIQRDLVRSD